MSNNSSMLENVESLMATPAPSSTQTDDLGETTINRKQLPTFIGIGAPKTATTFLARCLQKHPEVFMPITKEPQFFSANYFRGIEEYLKFFEGSERYECRGEFSTTYLYSPDAPKRIHDLLPDAKIILSVRNPTEQVYSVYWQLKRHNFYQTEENNINIEFSEAIKKFPDYMLDAARYHTHLKRWLQYFDKSQIHIVFYDDIKSDADAVLESLFDFLGVSTEVCLKHARSSNKVVFGGITPRNKLIGKLYGFIYVGLCKGIFMPMKRHLGFKTASWIKDKFRIADLLGKIFFRPGYPPIDPNDRLRVLEIFRDEIDGLESLMHRDLSAWKI